MNNFYEILGVDNSASLSDIKQAYRKLANLLHPDKGGDTSKFQELQEAYSVLTNPTKRTRYEYQEKQNTAEQEAAEEQVAKDLEEERLAQEAAAKKAVEDEKVGKVIRKILDIAFPVVGLLMVYILYSFGWTGAIGIVIAGFLFLKWIG